MFAGMHHEHDHVPIPKSLGGVSTYGCCITCHDLKDRVVFPKWPAEAAVTAVMSLVRGGALASIIAGTSPTELPASWSSWGRWERIAWAKIAMRMQQGSVEASADVVAALAASQRSSSG